ncbi:MAG: hypothetical protein RLZZ67_373 [Candidatus Parcubacteria bacterium]|jgi:prepilin-type N-terminal cleavage/methylation domain-containing protein
MNKTKGFTLIELLVVIAIIGILSSVVLASLNTARGKGADAAIKSSLNNMRAQAENVYDSASPNSYANVCSDSVILNALAAAKSAAGVTTATADATAVSSATVAACHATSTVGWAISVPLKTNSSLFACVDGTGQSTTTSVALRIQGSICGQ